MANYAPSTRARIADLVTGMRVERAAALVTAATVDLFTVTGGRVLLTGLLGEISVKIAAVATTLRILSTTTDTTAVLTYMSAVSADITGMDPGRMFTLPTAVGTALTISTGSSAADFSTASEWILKTGALQLLGSAAPGTGTIKWSAWYIPVDTGAYMTAA